MQQKIYGWFDSPEQKEPAYDPPKICLFCTNEKEGFFMVISLMLPGSDKSFFYRVHKSCYQNASEDEIQLYESSIVHELK